MIKSGTAVITTTGQRGTVTVVDHYGIATIVLMNGTEITRHIESLRRSNNTLA